MFETKEEAMKREYTIKRLSRKKKQDLIHSKKEPFVKEGEDA